MLSAAARHAQSLRRLPFWAMIAAVTVILTLGGFAAHGFDDNGFRLGSELAWRFTFLIYFAAVILGPLARLVPGARVQRFEGLGRQLLWGFCASFGVFLTSLLLPNSLTPIIPGHGGLTTGMVLFVVFGGGLTIVIAYAASPQPNLGERSRKTILGVGLSYFWLAYALNGFSHLSDPHRPDAFYGASVMLMGLALLLRFADRFVSKPRLKSGPHQA